MGSGVIHKDDGGRNEAELIRRKAQRYVMSKASAARLSYKEKSGRLAVCVLESEIPKVLHSLHQFKKAAESVLCRGTLCYDAGLS
jgi:hypothetical protein